MCASFFVDFIVDFLNNRKPSIFCCNDWNCLGLVFNDIYCVIVVVVVAVSVGFGGDDGVCFGELLIGNVLKKVTIN